jgi:hypothetical protein
MTIRYSTRLSPVSSYYPNRMMSTSRLLYVFSNFWGLRVADANTWQVGLDPPIRQGQTRHPYLVIQCSRDDEMEMELQLDESVQGLLLS